MKYSWDCCSWRSVLTLAFLLGAAFLFLTLGSFPVFAYPEGTPNYPLEIIQPRSGLTITNRFYKAYPGLEYNVRLAVIGGLYPYQYSLTAAPSGMTIDATTGVINWSNPATSGSPHTVTAKVTDSESQVQTVTWTITVTTSGFRFIDGINGKSVANGGTGTISNPWKSMVDLYGGTDYNSKYSATYAGEFIYWRKGTYFVEGFKENSPDLRVPFVANYKPQVWLAYPGESPYFDMKDACIEFYGSATNVYIEGITFHPNGNARGMGVVLSGTNQVFRRNIGYGITNGRDGGNNALLFITGGSYMVVQDNIWRDVNVGYGILGYSANKVLVENNTGYNIGSHVIGPKEGVSMWFIRGNTMYNNQSDSIGLQYSDSRGIQSGDIEISYNLVKSGGGAVRINSNYTANGKPVYIFRNTFLGSYAEQVKVTSTNGPWHWHYNVIVNSTSYPNKIQMTSIEDPSRVVVSNNLTGDASAGIVDANGNLNPSYSSYLGTHGYQIAMNDTTPDTAPPTSPTNLAATATSSSSITVSWNPATDNIGVTGYQVERCTGLSCSTFTQVGTPTNSPFTDSNLSASTGYSYHVRAVDAAGNVSGWSNVVGATTQASILTPTVSLSASPSAITNGQSSALTWSSTNATSCTASGSWSGIKATSGSESVSPTSTSTYTLSCTGAGGSIAKSATITVSLSSGCSPVSIYPAWDQNAFSSQTGTFTYAFTATPNASTGSLFGHSNGTATDYSSLATTVRFRDTGVIDAINGGSYSAVSSVPYSIGTSYSFRMVVNVSAKTYSVFVTPEGKSEQTIAANYAFRTAQSSVSKLDNFSSSDDVGTTGSVTVCNPHIDSSTSVTPQACSTITPTNFTDSTFTGYGAPYDVFASNTPLISTQCSSTDTHTLTATLGIPGDTTRIVYTKGYYYDPGINDWTSFTGTCTGALNGEWCQGSVSASVTNANISTASATDPAYVVGFTCSVQGGQWKCGCRDTSCSNFYWQVQGAGM